MIVSVMSVLVSLWLGGCSSAPEPAATPQEQAVRALAKSQQVGWVACDLAGHTDDPSTVRVPGHIVARAGSSLWFTVESVDGAVRLLPPAPPKPEQGADDTAMKAYFAAKAIADTPWGVATWSGAQGAETAGSCTVAPPTEVRVSGRVDGESASGAVVGCGGHFPVTAGRFEVVTTNGEPCTLRHDRAPNSHTATLDRHAPPAEVVVPAAPGRQSASDRVAQRLAGAADAVAEAKARLASLEGARAQVEEGPAAEVLDQWVAAATAQVVAAQNLYDQVNRFQGALKKAHDTYGQRPSLPPRRPAQGAEPGKRGKPGEPMQPPITPP